MYSIVVPLSSFRLFPIQGQFHPGYLTVRRSEQNFNRVFRRHRFHRHTVQPHLLLTGTHVSAAEHPQCRPAEGRRSILNFQGCNRLSPGRKLSVACQIGIAIRKIMLRTGGQPVFLVSIASSSPGNQSRPPFGMLAGEHPCVMPGPVDFVSFSGGFSVKALGKLSPHCSQSLCFRVRRGRRSGRRCRLYAGYCSPPRSRSGSAAALPTRA